MTVLPNQKHLHDHNIDFIFCCFAELHQIFFYLNLNVFDVYRITVAKIS